MRIAIIGAGNVGGTLGRRWAENGHDVSFGLRNPERGASAVKGGSGPLPAKAKVVAPDVAVKDADVIVLATPFGAVADALREVGADTGALDGKPVLDTTNPLKAGMQFDEGPNGQSAAERLQAMVPKARVVKAFNTTGAENMGNTSFKSGKPAMFYAGNDADARRVAHDLAAELGFEPVDAGALVRARELERVAMLWISLAFGAGGVPAIGRDFAFGLLRR